MAPRKPGPPGMSDTELRETLDLLSKVLANVSDRLDAEGELLLELARAKPNPELMATAAETAVKGSLEPLMHQLVDTLENLLGNKARLRQRLRDMRREEWAVGRWRAQLPLWLLLAGTLVVGPCSRLRRAPPSHGQRRHLLAHRRSVDGRHHGAQCLHVLATVSGEGARSPSSSAAGTRSLAHHKYA